MAQKKSSGSDGNEDEIQKLERQLSEAKKKKEIEELESEIASLRSKAAKKEPVIMVKGKAVPAGSRKMSKGAKIGVGIAIALGLVSCMALVSQTETTETAIPETEIVAEAPTDCLSVPSELIEGIASGTDDEPGSAPLTVTKSAAWKGPEGFFIALQFLDESQTQRQGVWLRYDSIRRNDIKYGLIFAVNGAAKTFTVYPKTTELSERFRFVVDSDNPGIKNSINCLG